MNNKNTFPRLSIPNNDITSGAQARGGTGLYSSEYIVSSYGIENFDFHAGLAWGSLNDRKDSFINPLSVFSDNFFDLLAGETITITFILFCKTSSSMRTNIYQSISSVSYTHLTLPTKLHV